MSLISNGSLSIELLQPLSVPQHDLPLSCFGERADSANEQPRCEIRKYQHAEQNVERFRDPAAGQKRRRDDKQNRSDIERQQGVTEAHAAESVALVELHANDDETILQRGLSEANAALPMTRNLIYFPLVTLLAACRQRNHRSAAR